MLAGIQYPNAVAKVLPGLARTFSVGDSEILVPRYLPTNLSTREIANELYVSASTVRTHIHHLYAGGHRARSCSVWAAGRPMRGHYRAIQPDAGHPVQPLVPRGPPPACRASRIAPRPDRENRPPISAQSLAPDISVRLGSGKPRT